MPCVCEGILPSIQITSTRRRCSSDAVEGVASIGPWNRCIEILFGQQVNVTEVFISQHQVKCHDWRLSSAVRRVAAAHAKSTGCPFWLRELEKGVGGGGVILSVSTTHLETVRQPLDTWSFYPDIKSTVEHINDEAYCNMPQICCTTAGYPKIMITIWLTTHSHASCRLGNA